MNSDFWLLKKEIKADQMLSDDSFESFQTTKVQIVILKRSVISDLLVFLLEWVNSEKYARH